MSVPQPLRIVFYSHAFYPNLGGIEAVSVMLATEFTRLGHEVMMITPVPSDEKGDGHFSFPVLRSPGRIEFLRAVRKCDVFFQNNISLPALWPLFFARKPWVVAHHTWIRSVSGQVNLAARLKLLATRFADASISISESIAQQFSPPQEIIGEPYDAAIFCEMHGISRVRELIFVGRLVSDKGVGDLLDALGLLDKKGISPRLTIVGDGPDRALLENRVRGLALSERVTFVGVKKGRELAEILHAHRVLVVPSRWEEPYGIVALEGLACGCTVVGSERGGLRDAMGPEGITFPNGDVAALAGAIEKTLDAKLESISEATKLHLANQTPAAVAVAYLEVLQKVARAS